MDILGIWNNVLIKVGIKQPVPDPTILQQLQAFGIQHAIVLLLIIVVLLILSPVCIMKYLAVQQQKEIVKPRRSTRLAKKRMSN